MLELWGAKRKTCRPQKRLSQDFQGRMSWRGTWYREGECT